MNDLKRKVPWYWTDFKDALALQCLASFIFLYFACLTPIITFGGLLGQATEDRIVSGILILLFLVWDKRWAIRSEAKPYGIR